MQQRYHRSAIIIIGGENAKQPIPGMAISSGAKAFIRNFTGSNDFTSIVNDVFMNLLADSYATLANESWWVGSN